MIMTNSRKRTVMNSDINISDHYADRFRKRIARTKRIEKFANDAYEFGQTENNIDNKRFRKYLKNIENKYKHTCAFRIYKGFVHVFDAFTATTITVYRIPNEYR